MATQTELIMDALANQITTELTPHFDHIQVVGRWNPNPTPPAIDIFPATEFQQSFGFGGGNNIFFFTIRAEVTTADQFGGQNQLLSLMDPLAPTSLRDAIEADKTLGGVVGQAHVIEGPSGYGPVIDPGQVVDPIYGSLLGCQWTVQVTP